jgi:hypothetical protein
MNIYDLSRDFWDFSFENPERVKPNHCAVYFFAIEHCNRLGWKQKFGFPTTMVMDAVSIKSYNTYISTLNDLVDFGFIEMIEKSRNQYSSNIIALSKFNKASDKALDKAMIKKEVCSIKKSESTIQSIVQSTSKSTIQSNSSIDKPINNITNTPINNIDSRKLKFAESLKIYLDLYGREMVNEFFKYWTEPNKINSKLKFELEKTWSVKLRLERWAKNNKNFKSGNNGTKQQTADERLQEAKSRILGTDSKFNESESNNEDFEFTGFEDVGNF